MAKAPSEFSRYSAVCKKMGFTYRLRLHHLGQAAKELGARLGIYE
jgi:hypothetical protein